MIFSNVCKRWEQKRKPRWHAKRVSSPSKIEKSELKWGEKASYRRIIRVSSNIEKVVMVWLINKNLYELDIYDTYWKLLIARVFVVFENVWQLSLSFETKLKVEFLKKFPGGRKTLKRILEKNYARIYLQH